MLSKTFSLPMESQNSSNTFAWILLWVFCSIHLFVDSTNPPVPIGQIDIVSPTFINFFYYSKVTRQRYIFHIFLELYSVKWISNNHLYTSQNSFRKKPKAILPEYNCNQDLVFEETKSVLVYTKCNANYFIGF